MIFIYWSVHITDRERSYKYEYNLTYVIANDPANDAYISL